MIETLGRGGGDGFCLDADGRFYVASTIEHGIRVVEPDGSIADFWPIEGKGLVHQLLLRRTRPAHPLRRRRAPRRRRREASPRPGAHLPPAGPALPTWRPACVPTEWVKVTPGSGVREIAGPLLGVFQRPAVFGEVEVLDAEAAAVVELVEAAEHGGEVDDAARVVDVHLRVAGLAWRSCT